MPERAGRCPLLANIRTQQLKKANRENIALKRLLYEKEVTQAAETIWKKFEGMRKTREVVHEDEEAKERELKWGRGEIGQEGEE